MSEQQQLYAVPKVERLGDLFNYSPLYARTFLAYCMPVQAVVRRQWPSISQKQQRDKFWGKFSA